MTAQGEGAQRRPVRKKTRAVRLLLGSPAAAEKTLLRLVRELDRQRAAGTLDAVTVAAFRAEIRIVREVVQLWRYRDDRGELDEIRAELDRLREGSRCREIGRS